MSGMENLIKWYRRADAEAIVEGALAYPRYHDIMVDLADIYDTTVERATAVFVSLSPNNEYVSNLRSAVTVLDAIKRGIPEHMTTTSTFNHCRARAFAYGSGDKDFLAETKGLKVISFYHNVVDPRDPTWVTVDGHIHAIWQDKEITMKQAVIGSPKTYYHVRDCIIAMADIMGKSPNAVQATLWFTRKRVLGIKYSDQRDIFALNSDLWRTYRDVRQMLPYKHNPVKTPQPVIECKQGILEGL